MSSPWDSDLEKGPQTSTAAIPLPPEFSSLAGYTSSDHVKDPFPGSSPAEGPHLRLSYGDRLVYNYLAPRRHPRFNNINYDDTIIHASRFRHLNITRIQHDLLRLQHVLTSPGGGTEENFSRLSSLLHEHATAIRDWDFVKSATIKISHNPGYMERTFSQYPELPWDKATAPHRLALLRETEPMPQNLVTLLGAVLPRSWSWSKTERELRPETYQLDLQSVPRVGPRHPSLTMTILAGIIVSVASSIWILVPTIIMSFQGDRTKSLITVAVAVTLFGFFLVAGVRTKTSETFLATATYAAVLVVFVGSSSSAYNG